MIAFESRGSHGQDTAKTCHCEIGRDAEVRASAKAVFNGSAAYRNYENGWPQRRAGLGLSRPRSGEDLRPHHPRHRTPLHSSAGARRPAGMLIIVDQHSRRVVAIVFGRCLVYVN
jgi:hypothetical protein